MHFAKTRRGNIVHAYYVLHLYTLWIYSYYTTKTNHFYSLVLTFSACKISSYFHLYDNWFLQDYLVTTASFVSFTLSALSSKFLHNFAGITNAKSN